MAEGKKAGSAFVELGVDDKLSKGLEKAQAKLRAFGDGVKALGAGMFAVGGAATGTLLAASKIFADVGSQVYDMSKRTGLSAEAVSELGYVAEQAGVEMGALENGVRRMQKTISEAAEGSEAATEAIEGLGLSLVQLEGKSPEEQFTLIADQLSRIGDPTLRAAKAMEVFGKSGTALIPMIEGGVRAMERGRKEARDFGLTISGEAAEAADKLGDAYGLMGKVAKDVFFEIGAALAPLLTDLAGVLTDVLKSVAKWVSENKEMIVTGLRVAAAVTGIGAALIGAGAVIVGIGAVLGAFGTILSSIVGIAGAIGTVLGVLASPFTMLVGLVLGAGGAVLYFSGALDGIGDKATRVFKGVDSIASTAVKGIVDALKAGDIELAAKIMGKGLEAAFTTIMAEIKIKWTNWISDLAGALTQLDGEKESIAKDASVSMIKANQSIGVIEHGWKRELASSLVFAMGAFTAAGGRGVVGFGNVLDAATEHFNKLELQAETTAIGSGVDSSDFAGPEQMDSDGGIRAALREHKSALDKWSEDEQKRIDGNITDRIKNIESDRDKALTDIEAGKQKAIKDLNDLAANAAWQREMADLSAEIDAIGSSVDASDAAIAPASLARAPEAIAEVMARIGSKGTFNADAALSLQASSSPIQRVAKAAERTAENTRRIAEKIENVGSYYTE